MTELTVPAARGERSGSRESRGRQKDKETKGDGIPQRPNDQVWIDLIELLLQNFDDVVFYIKYTC